MTNSFIALTPNVKKFNLGPRGWHGFKELLSDFPAEEKSFWFKQKYTPTISIISLWPPNFFFQLKNSINLTGKL